MAVLFEHILLKEKAKEETISQECIMVERKLAFEVFLAGEKSFKQKFFLEIIKIGDGIWGIFLLEYRKQIERRWRRTDRDAVSFIDGILLYDILHRIRLYKFGYKE